VRLIGGLTSEKIKPKVTVQQHQESIVTTMFQMSKKSGNRLVLGLMFGVTCIAVFTVAAPMDSRSDSRKPKQASQKPS
jgi:hypothetical protein